MDGLLGRMSLLMRSSAKNRLIYELVIEARRFGENHKDGGYKLDISEISLGARAGLSRETVSREMHKLKYSGLIEIRAKSIIVKDLSLLEDKLGNEA
jgi:CRP-like cAMP-binding protein